MSPRHRKLALVIGCYKPCDVTRAPVNIGKFKSLYTFVDGIKSIHQFVVILGGIFYPKLRPFFLVSFFQVEIVNIFNK